MRNEQRTGIKGLDNLTRTFLDYGLSLFSFKTPDHEQIHELWAKYGKALTKAFMAAPSWQPGQRPWIFWRCALPAKAEREFDPGKLLPLADGGCFIDRSQLRFSDSGLLSPRTVEYQSLAYATYAPAMLGRLETDLQILRRFKLATPEELVALRGQKHLEPLRATTELLPGKWVLLLRERQVRDLQAQHQDDFPYIMGEQAGARFVAFCPLLRHSKGAFGNLPFILADFQVFDFALPVFGWKRKDDPTIRRFREVFYTTAKKSGKSTTMAAVALYMIAADGEPGAEGYSAATSRDQSNLIHTEAIRMSKSSPQLRPFVSVIRNDIRVPSTNSNFRSLAADVDSVWGKNPSCLLIDELHAHKNRDLYSALETATGSRTQPLLCTVTTAGVDQHGLCWEIQSLGQHVLEGSLKNDEFFPFIATLDRDSDWDRPEVYHQANPNLGVTVQLKDLTIALTKAKLTDAAQQDFKRLRLNLWVEQSAAFIPFATWQACETPFNESDLYGKPVWAGLDLSSTTDFTALIVIYPFRREDGKEGVRILSRFWLPDATLEARAKQDRQPFSVWQQQGYIRTTHGPVLDYPAIAEDICEFLNKFSLQKLCVDPYNSQQISNFLKEGLGERTPGDKVIDVPQRYEFMNPSISKLQELILDRRLEHNGCPVMGWMMSNAVILRSKTAGLLRLDRSKSVSRIDGPSALITGLSPTVGMKPGDTGKKKSIYAPGGIRSGGLLWVGSDGVRGYE